jgi:carbonic anhydrase/acetyltransferase-like protein (isoleucine patch superfamily)
MPIYRLNPSVNDTVSREPRIDPTAWVAPGAIVVGQVHLSEEASVWFNAVLRADNEPIYVGARSNVQEGAVLHVDPGLALTIGTDVTIGHQAMLHGCQVGNGALIGIAAIVLNGAVIGEHSLIGAGSLITEGKVIPPRSLVMGSPGKVVRELTDNEVAGLLSGAKAYVLRSAQFRSQMQAV